MQNVVKLIEVFCDLCIIFVILNYMIRGGLFNEAKNLIKDLFGRRTL